MFDKMKELWELKKKAEEMKKQLEALTFESEDKNVKVTVKGTLEVENIELKKEPSEYSKAELEKSLKDNINSALKNAQIESARRAMNMGM